MKIKEECLTCSSISGEKRISPGPVILEGTYWMLEHAFPVLLKGWLVLVLKRHAEAFHELTNVEFVEFNVLLKKSVLLLRLVLGCKKEYIMHLAEGKGYKHVHIHIIARQNNLPKEFQGTKIFSLIGDKGNGTIPANKIKSLCEILKGKIGGI